MGINPLSGEALGNLLLTAAETHFLNTRSQELYGKPMVKKTLCQQYYNACDVVLPP